MISRRSLFKGLAGLAALPLVAAGWEAKEVRKKVWWYALDDGTHYENTDYFNEFTVVRGIDGHIVDVIYRDRRV